MTRPEKNSARSTLDEGLTAAGEDEDVARLALDALTAAVDDAGADLAVDGEAFGWSFKRATTAE